ncbi:hypothetical protein DH2020_005053 [Rehmannia glutinosa]|uniref:Protein TIC 22-like, chloroplastic n=1 Tax=Rehmannia glutinosa TaxID=99300 RepID=A0ABR0XR74_REHGL
MDFFKPKEPPATAATPLSPSQLLHQAVTSLQTHFSNFFHNLQSHPPHKSTFAARISNENNTFSSKFNASTNSNSTAKNYAMSAEAIEERLAGVPVYALSSGSQEFVLISGMNTGKNLGLFCFSEADAETLLKQMKSVDPSTSSASQVVAVALSKVFQLKVDGVALRLMPEASQIRNALEEGGRVGNPNESFPGVPVFQLFYLLTREGAPLAVEDLEKSLLRASRDQRQLNPGLRQGDIQVAVLEDIIQGMKDSSESSWDDVVFIPPGFDVSTDPSRK